AALRSAVRLRVGDDVVAWSGFEVGRGALNERIGRGAYADDDHVDGQYKLRALYGHGRAASAGIGSAKFHLHATRAGQPSLFVAEEGNGIGEHPELNSFFARVLHFLEPCGHLGFRAAVDKRSGPRAQTSGRAHRIHRRIAAADDHYVAVAAVVHRRVAGSRLVGAHQVHAREEFIGGVDAIEVFAGNTEKARQAGAGGNEDRVKVLVAHQFVDGDALAD